MAVLEGFATYCSELLCAVGEVRGKRMFGGYGLYVDDLFVAILVDDTMYLKADDETRAQFVEAGSEPFEYDSRGERHTMGYWSVPPEAMDSPDRMAPWAGLAIDAALRARKAPARKPRTTTGKRTMEKKTEADASQRIDERIAELGGWRGKTLAHVRGLIKQALPDIVEEWKWNVPVWSHGGIVCTGETYKSAVKLTFAKGASVDDPKGLFNSSLEGNTRRAIDIHEGGKIDEKAFKALVRAAASVNSTQAPAKRRS